MMDYEAFSKSRARPSPFLKNLCLSYFSGGLICVFGQILVSSFRAAGFDPDTSSLLTTGTLIFLACLFTGLGWFDRIAKHVGAGTLVPVTGFANSMCSPSIDNKAEGFIFGVGAKMFLIAGPVIVYGTATAVLLGIVIRVLMIFGIDITGWIL